MVPLLVGDSVLDVGCVFWEAGLQRPSEGDGFDAFEPNVDYCARQGCCEAVPAVLASRVASAGIPSLGEALVAITDF